MKLLEMIKRVVRRVIVVSVNKDDKDTQTVRVSYFGKVVNADLHNAYGVASNPPKDSQGIILEVEGQTDNRIALIGTASGIRIKELKEGEVVVGNFKNGNVVKFLEDKVEIFSNGDLDIEVEGDVNLTATNVNIDADQTNLGVGGAPIARVGDSVTIPSTATPGSPSSGTITSGGVNTSI